MILATQVGAVCAVAYLGHYLTGWPKKRPAEAGLVSSWRPRSPRRDDTQHHGFQFLRWPRLFAAWALVPTALNCNPFLSASEIEPAARTHTAGRKACEHIAVNETMTNQNVLRAAKNNEPINFAVRVNVLTHLGALHAREGGLNCHFVLNALERVESRKTGHATASMRVGASVILASSCVDRISAADMR